MATNGRVPTVQFYFDPACQWAWRASLWIREVAKVRPIDVEWKLFSLDLANRAAGNEPRQGHLRSWPPLRAMALARRQLGNAAVDRLYLAVARARHEREQMLDDEQMLAAALAESGLDAGLVAAALADPTTEEEVRDEHEGIASKGAFGVPTLVVDGAAPLFGPVITAVPTGEAAGEMWDRVSWLIDQPTFLELKRVRA